MRTAILAVLLPTFGGFLVGLPFWLSERNAFIGNVVGAGLIFAATLGFVAREFIVFAGQRQACLETRRNCREFSAANGFVRFAGYGLIGMFDVATLFSVSLVVERRRANRGVEKKWRS